ncbi:MAG: UbiA family prenyltransferase [Deltaproteobacteria bacterium]|nr:UbiA family prenyltransferase [Deltaproteobacteria bacterium]
MVNALVVLSRPRLLPFLLLLVAGGYGWAHWDRALFARHPASLLWVVLAWTALNAGTLWLNAALDRDEGPVLYGGKVSIPDRIAEWGYAALVAAVLLALPAGPKPAAAAAICALLAVGYSHPRLAWKGHPIGGPLVNWLGYGLLTPFAGWAVVDVPANPRTLLILAGVSSAVLGAYFAAQAFQADEDRARGYRTLVATHGSAAALLAARICVGLAVLDALLLAAIGWLPRECLLGAPAFLWLDRWLDGWARRPAGGSEADAREFARRALIGGITGILLATVDYVGDSVAHHPVAGLGTRGGHPPDRTVDDWRAEWASRSGL